MLYFDSWTVYLVTARGPRLQLNHHRRLWSVCSYTFKYFGLRASFCTWQSLGQRNLIRIVRWIRWQWHPDAGFEIGQPCNSSWPLFTVKLKLTFAVWLLKIKIWFSPWNGLNCIEDDKDTLDIWHLESGNKLSDFDNTPCVDISRPQTVPKSYQSCIGVYG